MKKCKLILSSFLAIITCLLAGIVAACTKNEITEPTLESVTIENKVELMRDWYVGGLEREVIVSFAPIGLEDTEYTVSSSAETVVSVSGNLIKPVGEGSSVITVTAENKTDSVTVTVKPVFKEFTVTNKSELSDNVWYIGTERTVEIAYDPADKYNAENMPAVISVQSDVKDIFAIDGLKITAQKLGNAIINVTAGGKTESFGVRVVNNFVALATVDPDYPTTSKILEGETLTLPELVATAPDGRDLTAEIKIEVSDHTKLTLNSEKTELTAGVYGSAGTYTVTYTVTDPLDDEKSADLQLSVNVYRNVLSSYNADDVKGDTVYKDGAKYVVNENQKITTTHGGENDLRAGFNIEPSKLYYAEATFNYPSPAYVDGSFHVGMGHYLENSADKRSVVGAMDIAAGNIEWDENRFYIRDYNPDSDGSMQNSHASATNPAFAWYKLNQLRGASVFDKTARTVTIQTARSGNSFYMFVNGNFIGTVDYEYFRDKATVPGIFGYKIVDNGAGVQDISNIVYYGGEKAQAKLDELLYANTNNYGLVTPYVYWNSEGGYQASAQNKVKTGKNEQRGVHFDYTKGNAGYYEGAVSPNVMFNGDFTFQFDYKNTSVSSTGAFMQLQVRPRRHDGTLFQVGAIFNDAWENGGKDRLKAGGDIDSGAATKSKMFVSNWDGFAGNALGDSIGAYPTRTAPSGMWSQDYDNVDDSQGYRYILTFKKEATQYLVKATVYSIADPTKQLTMTYKVSSTNLGNNAKWDEGFILVWNNYKCAGEYSNISWSYSVDESVHTVPVSAAVQADLPEAILDDKRYV